MFLRKEKRRAAARLLERALALATLAAVLSRGRSLVPRTPQDQTLITTGAGLMGAASGLVAEGVVAGLGKAVPGGRRGATGLLGALGLAGLGWARRRQGASAAAVSTASQVVLVAGLGGELAVAAWELMPDQQQSTLMTKVWTTALAAASAAGALRQRLAEPRDLVKASIGYTYLPTVSGGDGTRLPLDRLDREGRKFLGTAIPRDRIAQVMAGDARDPIRVFAGLDSAGSVAERARLAVEELERLGAFERSRIVFFCPTGAGYVDPVAVEAEELLSRGDVASVVVQYSNKRAVRAFKDLSRARQTWQTFLEQLGQALKGRDGPEIAVYGESLGAWVVAEALASEGAGAIRTLGIARGALVGLPFQARQKLRAIRDRGETLPEGLGSFGSLDDIAALPRDEREHLRYVLFTHPEDPVGNFSGARLLWERPPWLRPEGRHPRIPARMRWLPGITYLQLLFDVKNGIGSDATFENYAHDYRVELPALLRVAFGHPDVSDEQVHAIEDETVLSAERQARREARARVGPRRILDSA
jgi:uncharacterized membrane protein